MDFNLEHASHAEAGSVSAEAETAPNPNPPRGEACAGGGGCELDAVEVCAPACVPESQATVDSSPLIFFSLEDARNLVAERDRLLRQYEDVNRKVQALSVLVPDNMREKVFGSRPHFGGGAANSGSHAGGNGVISQAPPAPSLDDSIVELLDDCLEVMNQDQIEIAMWDIPEFSDKDKYTPEEIAKSLEKIARRGRVTKRGMNYASKELSKDSRTMVGSPTLVEATERVLRAADESLEAWEVINKLRDDVDVGERVKQKPNGVYAALSRLTSRRIAYRDANGYRIGAR